MSAKATQSRALDAIAAFQSAKGLDTLFDCLSIDEAVVVLDEWSEGRIDVEKWIEERLTTREEPEYHQKWKSVLQTYFVPGKLFTPKQEALLERIRQRRDAK